MTQEQTEEGFFTWGFVIIMFSWLLLMLPIFLLSKPPTIVQWLFLLSCYIGIVCIATTKTNEHGVVI